MKAGDEVICAVPSLESLGLLLGEIYTVEAEGRGPVTALIGPVVSVKGLPTEIYFSVDAFVKVDRKQIKKLING